MGMLSRSFVILIMVIIFLRKVKQKRKAQHSPVVSVYSVHKLQQSDNQLSFSHLRKSCTNQSKIAEKYMETTGIKSKCKEAYRILWGPSSLI